MKQIFQLILVLTLVTIISSHTTTNNIYIASDNLPVVTTKKEKAKIYNKKEKKTQKAYFEISEKQKRRLNKLLIKKALNSKTLFHVTCDTIILKNDKIIYGKVIEITSSDIKYKDCNNPNSAEITLQKQDVLQIKYSNGEINNLYSDDNSSNSPEENRILEVFGITSLSLSIIGIFLNVLAFISPISVLLFIGGITFGFISLRRFKRNPKKYKGRGFPIAGLILNGIIFSIIALIFLLFVLTASYW